MLNISGPEEDLPRSMECLEFVCRAPSDLFKAHRDHAPFVIPRQPGIDDLTSAAELLLNRIST